MRDSSLVKFLLSVPPSLSFAILIASGESNEFNEVVHQSFSCTSATAPGPRSRSLRRRRRSHQMAIYCKREKTTANGPKKKYFESHQRPDPSTNIRANMKKGFLPLWWLSSGYMMLRFSCAENNAHVYGATKTWIIIGWCGWLHSRITRARYRLLFMFWLHWRKIINYTINPCRLNMAMHHKSLDGFYYRNLELVFESIGWPLTF